MNDEQWAMNGEQRLEQWKNGMMEKKRRLEYWNVGSEEDWNNGRMVIGERNQKVKLERNDKWIGN